MNICRKHYATATIVALVALLPIAGSTASAPPTAPGFDGKTIRIGVISALTGLLGTAGTADTAGNKMWFEHVNSDLGGIAGKYKIELAVSDNHNDAPTTIQRYNDLKGNVVMFAQVFSTPSVKAVLPFVKDDNMLMSPSSFDKAFVHAPNTLPVGAPYQVQAANAVSYYLTGAGKGKTFCSLILDDAFGTGSEEGVEFAAQHDGSKVSPLVRFQRTDQDFTGQITQLKNAGCAGVWLASPAASETAKIMSDAQRLQFSPQWIALFTGWDTVLAKSALAPYLTAHMWVAGEGVDWGDTHVPEMKRFLSLQHRFAPQQAPNIETIVGYNQGRAVTDVLEQAVKMGDLSRQGILKAMNSLPVIRFDGLVGDYQYGAPEHRNPPRVTSIFKIQPGTPLGLHALRTNFSTPAGKDFPL
ncbi:MAG TPA: ABC transporter substrate-binding protein [Candidatus Lustribacter sp.]